jgi:hypothetical protein
MALANDRNCPSFDKSLLGILVTTESSHVVPHHLVARGLFEERGVAVRNDCHAPPLRRRASAALALSANTRESSAWTARNIVLMKTLSQHILESW